MKPSMSQVNIAARVSLRFFPVLLGLALLAALVLRVGPEVVWSQVHKVGLGLALIIILGGFGHFIRCWVWRLALVCDISALSWARSFGACLASEALGQLGVGGKALGEGVRIALLRPAVPLPNAISSSAIDGVIHLGTSAIVMLSGIGGTFLLASLMGKWRIFAFVFASTVMAVLALAIVAYGNRWPLMGRAARAVGRVPRIHNWIKSKLPVIDSSENTLLNF
ncbi:MAG TPA: hypothetical protein VG498_03745, partial [Terriglobales bacterium]|nr:hypothetical protein [Terriglobales bacterium]